MNRQGVQRFAPVTRWHSLGLLCGSALMDIAGNEGQRAGGARHLLPFHRRPHGHHRRVLVMNCPPVRPLAAMDAAEVDGPRGAGDPKVVTPRQVTVQPVPHMSLYLKSATFFIARAVPLLRTDAANAATEHFPNDLKKLK